MFAKAALLCALFAAKLALAQQPFCLLTAVNKFEHPADQKTICCQDASQVKSYLQDLCPSGMLTDANNAFQSLCQTAGYGSCSNSTSSSSSSSASKTSTASSKVSGSVSASATGSGAPYPVVVTSTYFDTVCSCTKTTSISSTVIPGSTGFKTGTAPFPTGTSGFGSGSGSGSGAAAGSGAGAGSGATATGSPITPATATGTGSTGAFTGAATKNIGSVAAAGLLAVAGIAAAL